jgi:transposase
VPSKKRDITIRQVAQDLGLDEAFVRDVLKEVPGLQVKREVADRIFNAARKLGYDFRKLKIGKRMQHRKEILDEVLEKIGENPRWTRSEIVKHLKEMRALVDRVHKRVFKDEFGG